VSLPLARKKDPENICRFQSAGAGRTQWLITICAELTLEAIKRIALLESLNQPLMVIFEDRHWIDEQTQELLNLLADSIGTAKVLLLVNYRPEYSHQWSSKTYYTHRKPKKPQS
jgi:hypothetical protein